MKSEVIPYRTKDPVDPNVRPVDDRGYDARHEAEESKRLIPDWMDTQIHSFCYPFCKKEGGLRDAAVAAGYKLARAGANGDKAYYPIGSAIDYFDIGCRHIGQFDRREDVGKWKRYGDRWHVLMFHGIGTDADGWWSISPGEFAREMSELAAYRDAGEVEVLTFADAAERMRMANLAIGVLDGCGAAMEKYGERLWGSAG